MNKQRRTSIVGGGILIVVGLALLLAQILPGFFIQFSWPWLVIGVGLFLFALGAALGEPGLAVPATIVSGIGGILTYQELTGNWESWSYAWTLIPGFVGLGIVLMHLMGGDDDSSIRDGLTLIFISLIMLAAFGSFFGLLGMAGDYWPVLLIVLGLVLLLRTLFTGGESKQEGQS
jgi:MFS family permease